MGLHRDFRKIYYILCIYIYINKYIHILDDSCWFIDPDASRCPWLYNVLPGGAVKVSHHWSRGIGTCHASERCLEYLGDGGWVRGWGHGLTPRVKHKRGFKTLNCSKPVGNRFFSPRLLPVFTGVLCSSNSKWLLLGCELGNVFHFPANSRSLPSGIKWGCADHAVVHSSEWVSSPQ